MAEGSFDHLNETDCTRADTIAPTAAYAAVLQHAEDTSLKQAAKPIGEVVRHPARVLYDDVFAAGHRMSHAPFRQRVE